MQRVIRDPAIIKEVEKQLSENVKKESEMLHSKQKFESQEKIREKRQKKKEKKQIKKQAQREAKKKLEEEAKAKISEDNSTSLMDHYRTKQDQLFGIKENRKPDLFPMGNVAGQRPLKEKEQKSVILHQYISGHGERSTNNRSWKTSSATDTYSLQHNSAANMNNRLQGMTKSVSSENSKSVSSGSSSLLQQHLEQYRQLMKVQPQRHTEHQLKEERERQKELLLHKQQQELDRLREKNREMNDSTKQQGKTYWEDFKEVGEEFERLRKEHIRKQRDLEMKRNEEEMKHLRQNRKQKVNWHKVDDLKWYQRTVPKLPTGFNRQQESQQNRYYERRSGFNTFKSRQNNTGNDDFVYYSDEED